MPQCWIGITLWGKNISEKKNKTGNSNDTIESSFCKDKVKRQSNFGWNGRIWTELAKIA